MASSLSNAVSPISTLPQDVLHYVFFLNAVDHTSCDWRKGNRDSSSPLNITRRCSQVCAAWRDLLLRSSSIWANCIELDTLAQAHSAWCNEVLQRTGHALLAIRVDRLDVVSRPETMHALLGGFIYEHWERVRVLDVTVECPEDMQDPRILDALSRPAPHLEEFVIRSRSQSEESDLALPEGFRLFSDTAPALRRFLPLLTCPAFLVGIRALLSSPRLRELCLKQPIEISALDLLVACGQLPSLELLVLNIARLLHDERQQCTVSSIPDRMPLPKLQRIHIFCSTPAIYATFLGRITAHPGCTFSMDITLDASTRGLEDAVPANIKEMQCLLVQHARGVINYARKPVTDAVLTVHLNLIHLTVTSWGAFASRFFFNLKAASDTEDIPLGILRSTIGAIASIAFPASIVRLALLCDNISDNSQTVRSRNLEVDESDGQQPTLVQSVWRCLQAMRGVTSLSTTPQSLASLFRISQSEYASDPDSAGDTPQIQAHFFPALRVVELSEPQHPDIAHDLRSIIPFLEQQHIYNRFTLRLTFSRLSDLRFLDRFTGMRVVFGKKSYICGSGDLETLFLGA